LRSVSDENCAFFFGDDFCDEYGEFFSDGLSGRSSVTQKICTYHAVEGAIGVNYGRVADNLPQPTVVANLVQALGIKNVKIYDTDATVLSAFANTGISVIVAVPNNEIVSLASSSSAARTWVQTNVKNFFPATQITYILVGNEVHNQLFSVTKRKYWIHNLAILGFSGIVF
jgi:hypothetical protein